MKTKKQLISFLFFSVFLIFGTGCAIVQPGYHHPSRTVILRTNPTGKIPPGQMKKMTGEKSARDYAPGQVKKHKKNK
jgi:hypothetical protein